MFDASNWSIGRVRGEGCGIKRNRRPKDIMQMKYNLQFA